MHFPILTFALFALSSLITASTLGDITQTSHKIADATDTKQYDKLDAVMTRDVIIDATALQPFTGGVLRGRDQVKARFRQAGAGAKTVHRITNFLLLEERGNEAKTSSYVDYGHYVKGALGDKTKTWRIQYRSENTWVKQGGEWKLQYNKLYDLAYGAERPFY